MPDLIKAIRVHDPWDDQESSLPKFDDQQICYWKHFYAENDSRQMKAGWYLYLPLCGIGNLCRHQIEEHEDGTITVSPSIMVTGHDRGKTTTRHGYLERGMWGEA